MYKLRALGLCFPLLLAVPAGVSAETIRLATLEWLPYVGKIVPKNGLSTVIATAAAKNAGHDLAVDYFEWTVTLEKGEKDPAFAGYFPEYYTDERASACHLSKSIGTSTLGLATMKGKTLEWKDMSDLNATKIGVVDGYSNGEAFDAMVKQGKQPVDLATSDTFNLRRLIGNKVPAIAIDREVLRYLLSKSPKRDETVFNAKPLAELTLHVCFKRTPAGKKMQEAFDAGLQKVNVEQITADYMKQFDRK